MYRILFISALFVPFTAYSSCFDQASRRYGIHPDLLRAISKVESNGNVRAINRNGNGSRDIGHMQINSSWLPTLKRYGITEQSLFDPCTNTLVGAWVLARNFRELGYNWNAIGAYNAKSQDKRAIYAQKVASALKTVRKGKQ
ncbi:lytic transglycosylase domain-containing protein [Nitrosomonas eutropha]|uniref:lytic transglycosylase domain-containing protein n=1 Tax=Nitrosomonas eutropha TaxID=916 RepID=UPI0009423350|nr:lytic transglycosylase domain-containing protein [Nitrosomonas eutropha]